MKTYHPREYWSQWVLILESNFKRKHDIRLLNKLTQLNNSTLCVFLDKLGVFELRKALEGSPPPPVSPEYMWLGWPSSGVEVSNFVVLPKGLFHIINSKFQGAQENGDSKCHAAPCATWESPDLQPLWMTLSFNTVLKTKNHSVDMNTDVNLHDRKKRKKDSWTWTVWWLW